MEVRRLLSSTVFGVTGAASTGEGQGYTMNLSGVGPDAANVDHWSIDWGDGGAAQTVAGFPSSVTHVYADGPGSGTVRATAVTTSGVSYLARNGAAADEATLDSGFGSAGKLTASSAGAAGVAVQADGKVLVAGSVSVTGQNSNFSLTRYNADGSLDTTFGAGGSVNTDFLTGTSSDNDLAGSVLVQPDGKIVVAGRSEYYGGSDFSAARYTSTGTLDTTFGTGGKVLLHVGTYDRNGANAVARQSDGKLVLAGWARTDTYYGPQFQFAVARLNADGSADTSFNATGGTTTNFPDANNNDEAESVAVAPDGKIVVGGWSQNVASLARYTSGAHRTRRSTPPACTNRPGSAPPLGGGAVGRESGGRR